MIKAKYIMCSRSAIKADKSGREVVFKLMSTGCPGVPVVNERLEVMGIITALDVLKSIKKGTDMERITASEIMSRDVRTADSETPVEELLDTMIEYNLPIIPIVKGKKFLGIVSRLEIIDTYLEPDLYQSFAKAK
ncbi:MAG TPA: CBS domain-containing protein [Thermodesulfovibrionales bacterium]|nr:CBS domain-containing protein [Thermodesulfovibrionales bacterium]